MRYLACADFFGCRFSISRRSNRRFTSTPKGLGTDIVTADAIILIGVCGSDVACGWSRPMSALGQKQMCSALGHVHFVPIADIDHYSITSSATVIRPMTE